MTKNQHASPESNNNTDDAAVSVNPVNAQESAAPAQAGDAAVPVAAADANLTSAPPADGLSVDSQNLTQAEASNEPYLENTVHEGEDGWLFLVSGSNNVLDLYKSESSFTSDMAEEWVALLQERAEKFQQLGIQYLHLPAPEKLTVMHRHYQGEIENVEGSPLLQLAAKHAAQIPCMVNVMPYFQRQLDNTQLYWKTDTHWSFWGCYSAYQLLCGRMGVEPHSAMLNYPYQEIDVVFDLGAKLDEPRSEKARFISLLKMPSVPMRTR